MDFFNTIKIEKVQKELITGIAKELDISAEEVLWMFIEMGNTFLILSQEDAELAKGIDTRGHLKEYKHWKQIAKVVHESFITYHKHTNKK